MPVISMFYGVIVLLKLVQARIEIHQEDLMANWQLATNGQAVFKIEPLR